MLFRIHFFHVRTSKRKQQQTSKQTNKNKTKRKNVRFFVVGIIADISLEIMETAKTFQIKHLPETELCVRIGNHTGSCCAGENIFMTLPRAPVRPSVRVSVGPCEQSVAETPCPFLKTHFHFFLRPFQHDK